MNSRTVFVVVLLFGLSLFAGCSPTDTVARREAQATPVFTFDQAALPGAKPWTSASFNS